MKKCLFSVLFLSCCLATALPAAELETIRNATLIEAGLNDGDSFKVKADGKELHLRLYYVDCLETTLSKADWNRILEQQYHFGLEDPVAVVRFGKQATEYVKRVLSRPFTIYTSYAKAPGRRYYAFIETHDGRDLGHLLVEQGLARIHGETHQAPDGTPSKFVRKELRNVLAFAIGSAMEYGRKPILNSSLNYAKSCWKKRRNGSNGRRRRRKNATSLST